MQFIPQSIPEIILIQPKVFGDNRGYFTETYHKAQLEQAVGFSINFIQDNESKSTKGVLRGLHYQLPPYAQTKLVRVITGEVLDIAVDIRQGSPTYGQYVSAILSGNNKHQLLIPRGFAHGFVVLSEEAIFSYKVDNYYAPEHDRGIAYNDPQIKLDWQLPVEQLHLSSKDQEQPFLNQIEDTGFYYGISPYA